MDVISVPSEASAYATACNGLCRMPPKDAFPFPVAYRCRVPSYLDTPPEGKGHSPPRLETLDFLPLKPWMNVLTIAEDLTFANGLRCSCREKTRAFIYLQKIEKGGREIILLFWKKKKIFVCTFNPLRIQLRSVSSAVYAYFTVEYSGHSRIYDFLISWMFVYLKDAFDCNKSSYIFIKFFIISN